MKLRLLASILVSSVLYTTTSHGSSQHRSLKERFNYASADCAAVVLKANREARGLTSILNNKKDQYMLNHCSASNKFLIVELCDDILIDTIVLGNYEFFSSTFKDTLVYVSDRYPPQDNHTWVKLAHLQSRNNRDSQVFPIEDPKIWARYVKLEFLTHYGHEYYCPLTVFKVYGKTQMEQFRKEQQEEEESQELDRNVEYMPVRRPNMPLMIGDGASKKPPAKSYLRDIEGLVSEYRVSALAPDDPAEPLKAQIPKVPELPQWGRQVDVEEEEYEDEEDEYYEYAEEDARQQSPPEKTLSTASFRQESIYKTIMRRLSRVERNITLAYHYLEEQHAIFSMILRQVETNNLENVQMAIKQLNHSTAKQMQSLTALSEEIWKAILYDMEEYQQQTSVGMKEMAGRMEFLAEEVLFGKRMNVAQLILLLTIVIMIAVNKVVTKLALIPESKKEK